MNANRLIDLSSYFGLIAFRGGKTAEFLQGQLTCDLKDVTAEQSRFGAYCTPQGRVLAVFRLFQYHDHYYLTLPDEILSTALQHFKKYAAFSKVTVEETSRHWRHFGCAGPDIEKILQKIFNKIPVDADAVGPQEHCVILRSYGTLPRFEIIGPPDKLEAIWSQLEQATQVDSIETWQLWDIQTGIPNLTAATLNLFTPQMLNLTAFNAVSFNKGCYIGQEIVARTHYLGKVKRHLHRVKFLSKHIPQSGDTLHDQFAKEAGVLVNVLLNKNTNEYHGLAVIKNDALAAGDVFLGKAKLSLL